MVCLGQNECPKYQGGRGTGFCIEEQFTNISAPKNNNKDLIK